MTLDVYLDPCTINCRKVLAALEHIGAPYNEHYINYFTAQHKSDEYVKINPMATVPAAKDGNCVITESNAILQYAADLANSDTYPKDLKHRANIHRWLYWESNSWFPSCYIYVVENVVKPLLKSTADQAALDAEAPRFHKLAGILNDHLASNKYLDGDNVTIADFAVASPMHLHEDCKLPLDKYPNVKRWIADIEKLPAWQKTQPAVEKALVPDKYAAKQNANGVASDSKLPESVEANFNYTKDVQPQLTELYFYEDPKAATIHEPGDSPHKMTVHNGWSKVKEFDVEKNGFCVSDFETKYDDWENEESVRQNFYPEIVEFVKRTTGASRVLVFDHTIRTQKNVAKKLTQETNTSQRAPVMLVHCDYTAESGPVRVEQLLPDEAKTLLSRRVAFYNVWKPLNVVEERPLAMCDVKTSPSDDFFKLYLRYRDRTGENYVMRHGDSHKWWYFPEMTPDKVIVLKTYESDEGGRARFVGHSAFEDPTTKKDATPRESVEIRTIAFF